MTKFQRVVVTGGTGFFGSWIHDALKTDGIANEIIALGRKDYDLTQETSVEKMLSECRPDAVIHAAGHVGGIGANRADPAVFLYDNLRMGSALIHHAALHKVKKFVLLGTVCSYPSHTPVPFKETDLWDGYPEETNAPYGIAKRTLVVQAEAYRRQYGLQISTLLPANLYGPRDHLDPQTSHVIPALIRKFEEAKKGTTEVTLWGDGSPTREFLYVDDAAHAVIAALKAPAFVGPCNIGSGREIPIAQLAKTVAELCDYSGRILYDAREPNGQLRRCLDVSRAQQLLGWKASTSLEEGLRQTILWYRNLRIS